MTIRAALLALPLTLALTAAGHAAPAPSASVSDARVVEPRDGGLAKARFVVRLSRASRRPVAVRFATVTAWAQERKDFAPRTGTLVFLPGETRRPVRVAILPDDIDEAGEAFALDIKPAARRRGVVRPRIRDARGVGTIADSADDGPPTITIRDARATESRRPASAAFLVELSHPTYRSIEMDFATAVGSAGADDFEQRSGRFVMGPWGRSATLSVPLRVDSLDEPEETFSVAVASPSYGTLVRARAQATIVDDDPTPPPPPSPPSVSVSDASAGEGGQARIEVRLSAPAKSTSTVRWETADGSATSGSDYAGASGTVTFSKGQTGRAFYVATHTDALDEPDETFDVVLSSPAGVTIADDRGTVTIVDDDEPPVVSVGDLEMIEGAGPTHANVPARLDAPSGRPVTVSFETVAGSADPGADYAESAGTVTFAPGQTEAVIAVPVHGDSVRELDESLFVQVSAPVNATLGWDVAAAIIANDDAGPCPDDAREDDDSPGQASDVEAGSTVTGLVVCDTDHFRVVVPAGATLIATALPDVPLDVTLGLTDLGATPLVADQDAAPAGGPEAVSWTNSGLTAAVVFVRAGGSASDTGHYALDVTLQ